MSRPEKTERPTITSHASAIDRRGRQWAAGGAYLGALPCDDRHGRLLGARAGAGCWAQLEVVDHACARRQRAARVQSVMPETRGERGDWTTGDALGTHMASTEFAYTVIYVSV